MILLKKTKKKKLCFINNIAFLKKKIKKYKIITQAWLIQPIQIWGKREYTISKQKKKQQGLAEILMP